MNIGQAAKQSGISAKMIRYYEDIGLLPASKRTDAGYRMYSEEDIKTLKFIQHSRELGFSTEQMKELMGLWKNEGRQSAEVKQLTQKHIDALNKKIADLQAMVSALQQSVDCCAGNQQAECEILNQIEQGAVHETLK
ncbi:MULTISPECIES: Cu(I)-responsive transcriptional regulator [Acinetobacter]|jgi:MerR family copper efflux transcriptional regulator|uniref:Cu(I)-responsive transcriptional regulator n=2 Tax=Acinetobacter TaxID=469 RepID=A0A4Q7AU33_9GAMM|nr:MULTISPECIES: Cu(I)-responsive transcriptional regulator [Acinetobacter]MCW8039658.1 Cu(I)-responsive transcriptional regulator [Acinetobacter entericus]RZG65722.1 Cu(I)-responsive transcriptional regulator [Acinetobacter bouvetii]TCB76844.1 Cu(I)-responsive transcriptional regulator [Acinetobacter sp. ANC 4177]